MNMNMNIINFVHNHFEENVECDDIVSKILTTYTQADILNLSKAWTTHKIEDFLTIESWLKRCVETEYEYYWENHPFNRD